MKVKFYLALVLVCVFYKSMCQSKNWAVPDFAVAQYAGSIGYFSVGAGYDVFKSNARFSIHYGVVPENMGGRLNVLSSKLIFKPATFTIWNRVKLSPFDVGLMASYHYGDKFEERWREGSKGYYWWHPALRLHLAMESSLTYVFPKDHRLTSITGYFEYNTNELYFVSYIKNTDSVSFWDIVKVGTGCRINF